MKKTFTTLHRKSVLIALLLAVSALIYLPRLNQIGYLNDDWYLMYSARAYGPEVFTDIFKIDRPARALVLIPAYTLFGDNPLYYNLSAYIFRVIASISFFWLLQMLWPRHRYTSFIAALLFLTYPGFISQINGIDYQSQMVSLAAAMLSIALSIKASLAQRILVKWAAIPLATLLGWFYLGLVEYFLGLELLRFASLYLLGTRSQIAVDKKSLAGLRETLQGLIIPVAFLTWRIFFFESERGATDISVQLTQFKEMPLVTGIWWLVRLISNTFSVIFLAWGIPFYQLVSYISRLRDLFFALAVAGVISSMLFWLARPFEDEQESSLEAQDWRPEALLIGLATAFAGLVPVILVNRQADFGDFSRYTLASSPGSALVLVSVLSLLSSRALRWAMLTLLLMAAVFTHHANSIRVADDTVSLRSFWWQVAWRIPQIKMGTTLVANYPVTPIQEDYFVWGPANLIYYPQGVAGDQIRIEIPAAVLNRNSLLKILGNGGKDHDNRRSIRSVTDYQNILVLSMPSRESCVHVIDGIDPEISPHEEERIMVIAPFSNPDLIDLTSEHHTPPEIVFGPEPPHDWCYYYEKADLARQRGDWEHIVRLGNEVLQIGFVPQDEIEWIPFLLAYAQAGEADRLDNIRRSMKNADPFVVQQACQKLGGMPGLSSNVIEVVDTFCSE